MTQKEKVLNLFGFLMDLMEEPNKKQKKKKKKPKNKKTSNSSVGQTNDSVKLSNPHLPHHPVLNPYISDIDKDKMPKSLKHGLKLINKMAEIDKEHANETMKTRIETNAKKPLIAELEELKNKMHDYAAVDKKNEEDLLEVGVEMENLSERKMGVTIEDGEIAFVKVPSVLRDNIPLDDKEEDNVDQVPTSNGESPEENNEEENN